MTRSELISKIVRSHPGLSSSKAERVVKTILASMAEHLACGERIEIRAGGSFDIHHRPLCVGRNPRTGEKVEVPGKPYVHFKAGKELRLRINSL